MIKEVLVKKREGFDVSAARLLDEVKTFLGIESISDVQIVNRYLVDNIADDVFEKSKNVVFSDPSVDEILAELPECDFCLGVEALPGQFDMRSDSAEECIFLMSGKVRPTVKNAIFYLFYGNITNDDKAKIENYLINPIECRAASLDILESLAIANTSITQEIDLSGFCDKKASQLENIIDDLGLAMNFDDLTLCQEYFRSENRDPTITEIRVIDTYWSDHCRHTTFNTELVDINIEDEQVKASYERYIELREEVGRSDKPITLMDLGTIGARVLKHRGILTDVEESEENNACTINFKCNVDGRQEDWLYFFKNETHNHPTEIEPFGGASTCIGGAIRDPLSGRAYCYQAMRVTGAGNPLQKLDDTLPGKLPQRKICKDAAEGYSSYGNQIGLATGLVDEIYHPGYVAKRMEIGAVVGCAPKENVKRLAPRQGDIVVLLGGKTGRDGIGGATGSSKSHTDLSLSTCGSEVQKGNAPVERKLQRFFRNGEAAKLIKKCNDFGAGGVSVAVGELSDSVKINLNAIPKKYDGLNATELAISESQERMACVIDASDKDFFLRLAEAENLEATIIAEITDDGRLVETFNGENVVDIKRSFLDTFGASRHADVHVPEFSSRVVAEKLSVEEALEKTAEDLNCAAKRGLVEMFDSTIGSGCVVFPYGGKYQATKSSVMVSKIATGTSDTTTVSGMSYGQDIANADDNPYMSGFNAVFRSVLNLVCAGFSVHNIHLSFQEYFKKLTSNKDWGEPLSVLLGALDAQMLLGCAAIGGKDSMSGSYLDKYVPPTLVSFATAICDVDNVITNDIKDDKYATSFVYVCTTAKDPFDVEYVKLFDALHDLIKRGLIKSCIPNSTGKMFDSMLNSSLGNEVGIWNESWVKYEEFFEDDSLKPEKILFIVECYDVDLDEICTSLGCESVKGVLALEFGESCYESFAFEGDFFKIDKYKELSQAKLASVYPYLTDEVSVKTISSDAKTHSRTGVLLGAKPKVVIPVFPGTNCEYDCEKAFIEAGADVQTIVINDMSATHIKDSIDRVEKALNSSEILMIPGGFSGGDEPDGSAKFIASFFRNDKLNSAIEDLLYTRDGLILGICNGFQALLKLGLLPYGHICDIDETSATLTYNNIARHQSKMVNTRVSSVLSPWMSRFKVGDVHTIPISHGEGKFVCSDEELEKLISAGQIAAQYCDLGGNVSGSIDFNPAGSTLSIEAISSVDGKILGKMGHSERRGAGLYKNIPGNKFQELFEGGVDYFKN